MAVSHLTPVVPRPPPSTLMAARRRDASLPPCGARPVPSTLAQRSPTTPRQSARSSASSLQGPGPRCRARLHVRRCRFGVVPEQGDGTHHLLLRTSRCRPWTDEQYVGHIQRSCVNGCFPR
ncbi:uncharacterized protein [Miscanthus floridulus]|uniref:uncharacterized protein n=1 Tax=Miscanthus floridulus TaxID=154761 RepID=UPI00345AA90E